ncbi:hypothetical protein [Anaeromassilibacillus sp. SJQ-1]|uniref:hypothetical protein n=1 Tax=Anaeromassilibacillus sp. SJQ-1 TaxID=3375419 RepID=UPI00398A2475
MQKVSQAWKDIQKKRIITEPSFIEVTLNVGDPDAQLDAAATDNGHENYSNTPKIADGTEVIPGRYATLEDDIWVLDGTYQILPDDPPWGNNGYIGYELSGADREYETYPTITLQFSKVYSSLIPGITITWSETYNEYAESFKITAYNGASVVAQETVQNNQDILSVVSLDIQNYNKITIQVLKWCKPYRRARISRMVIGILKSYQNTDLMAYQHGMFVDLLSANLPKSEIIFQLLNINGEYNPDNPQGTEKYLMERQTVTVKYGYLMGINVEWIKAGTFFISEWDTPQNGITATFTARDALEYMSDLYSGPSTGTFMEIAKSALQQANLPKKSDGSNQWELSDLLNDLEAPEGIDLTENTIAEVLQLIANASCCVFYQDREGIIHINPLNKDLTDYRIDRDNSFANSEIELTKQLKSVNVNDGEFVLSVGNVGETQNVKNPLISKDRGEEVAIWTSEILSNRRIFSGEWRADPRLDAMDKITVENKFAESTVFVTQVEYTYNGAFRGMYEGRAVV